MALASSPDLTEKVQQCVPHFEALSSSTEAKDAQFTRNQRGKKVLTSFLNPLFLGSHGKWTF